MNGPHERRDLARALETAGAWLLALLWISPLAYAVWTAFHPSEFSVRFTLDAPLTLRSYRVVLVGVIAAAVVWSSTSFLMLEPSDSRSRRPVGGRPRRSPQELREL